MRSGYQTLTDLSDEADATRDPVEFQEVAFSTPACPSASFNFKFCTLACGPVLKGTAGSGRERVALAEGLEALRPTGVVLECDSAYCVLDIIQG